MGLEQNNSKQLYERAIQVIPGGVNSPVRAFRSVGGTPIFMESGSGCRITDVDGNSYVDFCNSWGPLIFGHRPPVVMEAVRAQLDKALTLGTPCQAEVEIAEYVVSELRKRVSSIERIRFVNSGTEAVMSALRLARGYTGRNKIIKFDGCYHGHSDALLVKAGSGLATAGIPDSHGVPTDFTAGTIVLPLDDESALQQAFQQHGSDLAAVIIEAVPANNGLLLQRPEYLQKLQEICRNYDTLLIVDEVISGFRVGFGGASEHYGLTPDLVTYGKIIGGGMPVGAFAGRADVFAKLAPDGPVYQAGTLSGNPVAMRAGLAQLQALQPDVYTHLNRLGEYLATGFNKRDFPWKIQQIHSIFWLHAGAEPPRRADRINRDAMQTYAQLHRHCLERGVYLAPSGYEVGFISAPMTETEIDQLLQTLVEFFEQR